MGEYMANKWLTFVYQTNLSLELSARFDSQIYTNARIPVGVCVAGVGEEAYKSKATTLSLAAAQCTYILSYMYKHNTHVYTYLYVSTKYLSNTLLPYPHHTLPHYTPPHPLAHTHAHMHVRATYV